MNLGSWLGLTGIFIQLPLMIPITPENWTLPSVISLCGAVANIMPAVVIFLRWYQGKRFSEIPYIYLTIILGIILRCILSIFWQETMFIFGRARSVWLIGSIFVLSMLACTSSLVFFDYMKRFRSNYLNAVFLSEGLTSAIPTLLLLIQGIGGEAICVETSNGTIAKPTFTQPRFSVSVFMLITTGITVLSLIAFVLLRWTNIISLANAAESVKVKETSNNIDENLPMNSPTESSKPIVIKPFIFLLSLNAFSAFMLIGLLPPLTTYSILPYGQKTLYYSILFSPLGYFMALILSLRWTMISMRMTIIGTLVGCIFTIFTIIIAAQSPCPWWADSLHGAIIIVLSGSLLAIIIGFIRITIGNRIKKEWSNEKGMFYFSATYELGAFVGTIPMYLLVNVFDVFIDRKPCQIYCVK